MAEGAWPRRLGTLWVLLAFLVFSPHSVRAQERLGSFNIDRGKVSISGISSGAFMANQFHVAHAELIMGAGIVAGGLYGCAVLRIDAANKALDATVSRALDRCMAAKAPLDSVETYVERMRTLAAAGTIDPLTALAGDKVYLFTGRADSVVAPDTVERAAEVYRAAGIAEEDLMLQKFLEERSADTGAGHSWVTDDCCQRCPANETPYINDCDYDQAGAILQHIYGALRPKATTLSGRFVEFSQTEFLPGGQAAAQGLHETGVAYVPETCAAGERCALHVVLHGCEQSTEVLDDTFYKNVGVNEWADSNAIVVLYPQAASVDRATLDAAFPDRKFGNAFAVNPHGCWNWWGYAHDTRFALKEGVQITALYAMIRRVMGEGGG